MKFSLNIDHVAFLRNARGEGYPDPITFALMAEQIGVDGIVVHLREDRRHIKDDDLIKLRKVIRTKLDLEMAAEKEIIEIACDVKPDLVTLVPEKREELTTEGGLDVVANFKNIKTAVDQLESCGIPVSLFIEPDFQQIESSLSAGAKYIEIHTGRYANLLLEDEIKNELERIKKAAVFAKNIGLGVNAGHGLNYKNLKRISLIKDIDEVSIGQSIIARSVFFGLQHSLNEIFEILR